MTKYEAHPAADVWPMIPADEMQELADSIKSKGQMEPIVVKGDLIIDGRNRLAACELAGVEPMFQELDDDVDPLDYIEAHNHNRRHMTLGARTMAVIKMRPEKAKTGRKNSSSNGEKLTAVEMNYRSKARTVLAELPMADVDAVINGAKPLNEAYKEAVTKREAKNDPSKLLADLQNRAPDLALRVTEDGMDLEEAIAACEQREANERANRAAAYMVIRDFAKAAKELMNGGSERLRLLSGRQEEFEKEAKMSIAEIVDISHDLNAFERIAQIAETLEGKR